MKETTSFWTLVQHSGYLVGKEPDFARAVETLSTDSNKAAAVTRAGGLVFTDYARADYAEYLVNYAHDSTGLIPKVRGSFGRDIGGRPVYLPAEGERAEIVAATYLKALREADSARQRNSIAAAARRSADAFEHLAGFNRERFLAAALGVPA